MNIVTILINSLYVLLMNIINIPQLDQIVASDQRGVFDEEEQGEALHHKEIMDHIIYYNMKYITLIVGTSVLI